MNFLISQNSALIAQYWPLLLEMGESLLLDNFNPLLLATTPVKSGILVIDTRISGFTDAAQIAHIKHTNQHLKILIISHLENAEQELAMLAAGASGSCNTQLSPEKIRQVLNKINDGGVWISVLALPQLLVKLKQWEKTAQPKQDQPQQEDQAKKMASLTPREREIVNLIAKGESNKLIARALNISDRTVKSHLSIVFQKLKVNDRLQLALVANRHHNNI